jgi:hypothetical protein
MAGQIYLDLDGVLADFDRGAGSIFKMSPHEYESKYGPGRFWKKLATTDDFYNTLELLPDAMDLYNAVKDQDPIILTGLPIGRWAEPQKRKWAERHFPKVQVITTTARNKHKFCSPGDVLVDDRDKYRDKWEEAGGIFIHHTTAAHTIEELRRHGFIR